VELGRPSANQALALLLCAVVAVAVAGAGLPRRPLGGGARAGRVVAAVALTAETEKISESYFFYCVMVTFLRVCRFVKLYFLVCGISCTVKRGEKWGCV